MIPITIPAKTEAPVSSPQNKVLLSVLNRGINLALLETASKILEIIFRYQLACGRKEDLQTDVGALSSLTRVYSHVKAGKPVRMCMPAFPFKSPNSKRKVLGRLPDKAEEFALAHLNGLCASIQDVYSPGANLTIVSDGIVYNDLLSVSDSDVWAYGQALRDLAVSKGFHHIQFSRLGDLVPSCGPVAEDGISYVSNAANFRLGLMSFANQNWDVTAKIQEDTDVCLTYRGYIKFLQTDLESVYPVGAIWSKKKFKLVVERIAKQMLIRGQAFARAVREGFPDHVRLSIHPSSGQNKISISPLPTDTGFTTPWHCTLAVRLDGSITTGHAEIFERDPTFELVYENGAPSFYREKTDLFNWKGGPITCSPLYPCGLLIQPEAGPMKMSVKDLDAPKVRQLAELNSPVILRGFSGTGDRDRFIEKSSEFGTPLPWKFGLLLEVKNRGTDTRGLNNVLSTEWMPFHYDGLFKTEERQNDDGSKYKVSVPPRFQLFTAVTPSPSNTGYTLFSTSTFIFKYLPPDIPLDFLKTLTWSVSTSSFESTKLGNIPLVVDHPVTGKPCLRYHEPWPQSKTKFEATDITIDHQPLEVGQNICRILDDVLHDRRVVYYHAWQQGDVLVSDNILTLHTRSDFQSSVDRELWRIHFD